MTTFENLSIDGTPVIRAENDFLQVDVAPGVGGRVVNILHKASGHQFLWHNAALKLEKLEPGAAYDPNFYGAIDELIPNDIPETINGVECPDHGELWTAALGHRIDGETLVLSGTLPLFGLRYERRMALAADGPAIDVGYRIENISGARREFLWKLHAALKIGPGDRIVSPARTAVVGDPEYSRWRSTAPFEWPYVEGQRADVIPDKDGSMDFLYLYNLPEGRMAWESADGTLTFAYEFDLKVFPFAWLFASFGGFDDHYMAILEPCTTMPISVNEAARLGQCSVLEVGETLETRVSIYAGPVKT
ncbi:MAG: hypothetical protein Kow0063_41020 [Anaerolineae bacterium]